MWVAAKQSFNEKDGKALLKVIVVVVRLNCEMFLT